MVRESKLEPRDRVLVRLVGLKGKHKLSDKWEYEPYVVLSQPSLGIPVYKVRKETSKGRIRTLHRNMLLPFFGLPVPLQKVKQQKPKLAQKPQVQDSDSPLDSSSSDSESESSTSPDQYVIPQCRKGVDIPSFMEIGQLIQLIPEKKIF